MGMLQAKALWNGGLLRKGLTKSKMACKERFGILRDKLSFSKCFNVLNYDVILLVLEWTSEPVADGNLCMW